jgi:hypothetical protein
MGAVAGGMLTTSCMPSLGTRLGGAVMISSETSETLAQTSVAVGTRELPVLMGVVRVERGPSVQGLILSPEVNVPLARYLSAGEYPRTPWARIRFDIGSRQVNDKGGSTLGVSTGIGYPLAIAVNAAGDASHVLQLTLEASVARSVTTDFILGPTIEYIFVPHREARSEAR